MATPQRGWRLAIAGTGHRGRYFQERWRLFRDEPAVPFVDGTPLPPLGTAVFVSQPHEERGALVADLLSAGYAVLVEPPLASTWTEARDLFALAHEKSVSLQVIGLRRTEPDFLAATAAVTSGRLGTAIAYRWQAAEYAIWADEAATDYRRGETLAVAGPPLFDQLARLVTAPPQRIRGQSYPAEDGFAAEILFADGSQARLELRRIARAALRTGWMIEGTTGAYQQRKLITTTTDGELVDETLPFAVPPTDVFQELAAMPHLEPMSTTEQQRCLIAAGIYEAVQRSIAMDMPVEWTEITGANAEPG